MTTNSPPNNPLEFAQNLWGKMGFSLPGMVTPTFDVNELEKRLVDLKAVEGWLKMNLSMLQMTIQTLEMQCTTLNAVKQMSNIKPDLGSASTLSFAKQPTATKPPVTKSPAKPDEKDDVGDALQATMWPWALMQQIQTQMQEAMEKQGASATKPEKSPTKPGKNSS